MARYFAFNTLAGAGRNSGTNILDGDTTSGRFDSAFVASCISCVNGGSAPFGDYFEVAAPFAEGSTSLSSIYLRFDMWNQFTGGAAEWVRWISAGTPVYRIVNKGVAGVWFMQWWNSGTSAWVDWGSSLNLGSGFLNIIQVRIVCQTSYEVRIAGAVVGSSSTAVGSAAASFDAIRLQNTNTTGITYYSQIMGADYDLQNAHMYSKLANANGFYTAGTGTFTDINEAVLNDATAIALPASGDAKTFTKASIGTLPAGLIIAGAVVNARGRVSGGVVTDGKIRIRNSSTNADSGNKSFPGAYAARSHFFANDPATGSPYATAGAFDSTEFGVLAA